MSLNRAVYTIGWYVSITADWYIKQITITSYFSIIENKISVKYPNIVYNIGNVKADSHMKKSYKRILLLDR
jgi:hypothetical protein